MRNLLLVGAAAAMALLVWAVLRTSAMPEDAGGSAPDRISERDRDLLARLEGEMRSLSARVERLDGEVASLRRSLRAVVAGGGGAAAAPGGERPKTIFDRYVASFDDGGTGSEYFRLGVDAFAPALIDEIVAAIEDPSRPAGLRERLAAILATARFKGDGRAVGALLGLLDADTPPSLLNTALRGLAIVGDATAAGTLEDRLWSLPAGQRAMAITNLVVLAGEEADRALGRLLATAPDDGSRMTVLALVPGTDPEAAAGVFRAAFRTGAPVRLAAAQRLTRIKAAEFTALVEELLAAETDGRVKTALMSALSFQKSIPNWHPMRAAGPADVDDVTKDHPNAWASQAADGGAEWLELTYDPPLRASAVRIHEVLSAGAVVRVETTDTSGAKSTVWSGTDPTAQPGVFEATFAATARPVRKVRVTLDTKPKPGWNEIDAVEIVGPDGRAWAKSATASSYYGQR